MKHNKIKDASLIQAIIPYVTSASDFYFYTAWTDKLKLHDMENQAKYFKTTRRPKDMFYLRVKLERMKKADVYGVSNLLIAFHGISLNPGPSAKNIASTENNNILEA